MLSESRASTISRSSLHLARRRLHGFRVAQRVRTDRVFVHAERGVYVEVRGDGALAPPQVHHVEARVAVRRQRLQPHAPLAIGAKRGILKTDAARANEFL